MELPGWWWWSTGVETFQSYLEMFHSVNAHIADNQGCLLAEDVDDADVVLGVEVSRKYSLSEDLVEQLIPCLIRLLLLVGGGGGR